MIESDQAIANALLAGVPLDAHSLKFVLDSLPVGISWSSLSDQKILFMNRRFTAIFGYKVSDFRSIPDWIAATFPFAEDRELASDRWAASSPHPEGAKLALEPMEVRIRCKDGLVKTILHSGVVLRRAGWALATFVDISDRKRDELLLAAAEREAREGEAIHRLLLDHSPGMTMVARLDGSCRYVSPGVLPITGFTQQEYLPLPSAAKFHPNDGDAWRAVLDRLHAGTISQTFRIRIRHKTRGYRWVESTLTGYVDPASQQMAGYVVNVRDIDALKKREDTLATEYRHLSRVAALDDLTQIANRRTFNQTLDAETAARSGLRQLSLLLLDVDYFKQYNDLYGHLPGDSCLKQVARVIETVVRRDADLAARFGGDEFVALLPVTDEEGATLIARAIAAGVARLAIPHAGNPHGIVTVSIGIACWPAGARLRQKALLECADQALYQAKGNGRNTYRALQCSPDSPEG
ncbi:MAG TPA: diguanylate cyclase [Acidobacteriaceae bacterium]